VGQNDLAGLPVERIGLLLVDFQNQFCHPPACGPGPVTNTGNTATAHRANAFAGEAAKLGMRVIYTRQVLDPKHLTARQLHWDHQLNLCPKGSWEAELFMDPVPGSVIVTKHRFDVWQSHEFSRLPPGRPGRWFHHRRCGAAVLRAVRHPGSR
jgi:nicotinamidase-related amidase